MPDDYQEKWEMFLQGCKKARSGIKERAMPTQFLVVRQGEEMGYAVAEADAESIAQYAVALLTAFGADEVFVCMDTFWAGEQFTSPYTGKKWAHGEMEFDFKENPDTQIKEALMNWSISSDHAKVVRHVVLTYTRTPDGMVWDEPNDVPADTSEGIQRALHEFFHKSQNVFGSLMDKIRSAANTEWKLAMLDKAALVQINEMFTFAKLGLIAHDDGSDRTRILQEGEGGKFTSSQWIGGDKDGEPVA